MGKAFKIAVYGGAGFSVMLGVGVLAGTTGGIANIALGGVVTSAKGIAGGAAWAGNGLESLTANLA